MLSQRFRFSSLATHNLLSYSSRSRILSLALHFQRYTLNRSPKNHFCCCVKPIKQNGFISESNNLHFSKDSPFSGMEDSLVSYLFGKKKATDLAHIYGAYILQNRQAGFPIIRGWIPRFSHPFPRVENKRKKNNNSKEKPPYESPVDRLRVWKHVVQKGDTVVDATCGNGLDTLTMLNLVADDSHKGYVYALDIQKDALDKTSILLEESLNSNEKQFVKLFSICHSKMEEVVPKNASVRLVAFNLGYLPGGDKELITRSETTLLALEAAKRILIPGGLISIVVYVGHPGGREELEAVESFAAGMSAEDWICCKLHMLNRPSAPVPIFLFRR